MQQQDTDTSSDVWMFPPAFNQFIEEQRHAERTIEELSAAELVALQQLQEDMVGLQAYAMLTQTLGLSPTADVATVGEALHARDITLDEAADWLPACDYSLDCYRQTMSEELRAGEERVRAKRVATGLGLVALGVLGTAGYVYWRRR